MFSKVLGLSLNAERPVRQFASSSLGCSRITVGGVGAGSLGGDSDLGFRGVHGKVEPPVNVVGAMVAAGMPGDLVAEAVRSYERMYRAYCGDLSVGSEASQSISPAVSIASRSSVRRGRRGKKKGAETATTVVSDSAQEVPALRNVSPATVSESVVRATLNFDHPDGYCYLSIIGAEYVQLASSVLGPRPKFLDLAAAPFEWFIPVQLLSAVRVEVDHYRRVLHFGAAVQTPIRFFTLVRSLPPSAGFAGSLRAAASVYSPGVAHEFNDPSWLVGGVSGGTVESAIANTAKPVAFPQRIYEQVPTGALISVSVPGERVALIQRVRADVCDYLVFVGFDERGLGFYPVSCLASSSQARSVIHGRNSGGTFEIFDFSSNFDRKLAVSGSFVDYSTIRARVFSSFSGKKSFSQACADAGGVWEAGSFSAGGVEASFEHGQCYLAVIERTHRAEAVAVLGFWPPLRLLASLPPQWYRTEAEISRVRVAADGARLHFSFGGESLCGAAELLAAASQSSQLGFRVSSDAVRHVGASTWFSPELCVGGVFSRPKVNKVRLPDRRTCVGHDWRLVTVFPAASMGISVTDGSTVHLISESASVKMFHESGQLRSRDGSEIMGILVSAPPDTYQLVLGIVDGQWYYEFSL